ncbi:MAG: hypothetical protein V4619_01220 [Bacteroidota bacterium]
METNNQNPENGNRNETTRRNQTEQENAGGAAAHREQQQHDNSEQFNEQSGVTPNEERNFPSEGPSRGSFADRPHGRTTGRMIGHEPETE